jgi:hypothetical protein
MVALTRPLGPALLMQALEIDSACGQVAPALGPA